MICLRRATRLSTAMLFAAALPATLPAQQRLTSPKEFFGHDIGADYELPNYTKLHAFFATIAKQSDRVILDTIGLTEEGRPQIMAIVSSPANLKNLARYKEISTRLANAEGLDSAEAAKLAKEGKVVFWIDGGLHATEVLGAQQLIESFYQLASRTDDETMRILNDCIILMTHANPDGMELVSNWYMQEPDKLRRNSNIPRLYEKYAGHDNNRDAYMNALAETRNMSQQLFVQWNPQIMYNHHQTGPTGTIMAAPPYRDPANYWFHPAMITGLDLVGAALNHRFVLEHKPGLTFRAGSNYSTWWNGGMRTVGYYHNQIGILTETIGNPTPIRVSLVPDRQLRSANLPMPVAPQEWHFRQSIDYSVSANYAFLDLASRYRETFLFNRWVMGNDQIKNGSKDNWTISPKRVDAMIAQITKDRGTASPEANRAGGPRGAGTAPNIGSAVTNDRYMAELKKPENRDPRAYVLSSAQNDFPTATKFVKALQYSGIQVHRATGSFSANGKSFPAGSWVVMTNQAFRSHALDMFEPQDHPNDFRYPGGPPIPPYDNAGWTLALQMGIQFERVLDGLTGPFEKVNGVTMMPMGTVAKGKAGYFIRPEVNDASTVANRLAAVKVKASRIPTAFTDRSTIWPAGSWFIPAGGAADKVVTQAAKELGVNFSAANSKPGAAQPVQPLRIALIDRYGGSMPSGWTRLILEKFEFPFAVIYPQDVDAGNLKAKYDVIVVTDGAFSAAGAGRGFGGSPDTTLIPAEFRRTIGRISPEKSVPALKSFVEAGGRIVAIGSSIELGNAMGLPIDNYLAEANGRPYAGEKYYIPGSLLEVKLDTSATIATGMNPRPSVMFDNSPVMKLGPDAAAKGVRVLATFDTDKPLTSGWAWGQELLKGGVAMAEAKIGRGTIWLFGPEILFRSQAHGTYKLFLNALDGGFQRPSKPLQ
ncbi:M14 family metallopeptidase [Gemmatimonas sp.]|uniref:M14 family metallopeptidase n=1 Tax=Gemmatimonas sp. TaxID=1962908 RepID=UPI003982EA21